MPDDFIIAYNLRHLSKDRKQISLTSPCRMCRSRDFKCRYSKQQDPPKLRESGTELLAPLLALLASLHQPTAVESLRAAASTSDKKRIYGGAQSSFLICELVHLGERRQHVQLLAHYCHLTQTKMKEKILVSPVGQLRPSLSLAT